MENISIHKIKTTDYEVITNRKLVDFILGEFANYDNNKGFIIFRQLLIKQKGENISNIIGFINSVSTDINGVIIK